MLIKCCGDQSLNAQVQKDHNASVLVNPYRAGQILPILHCVPSVTKVMLLHFIHTLPSVTKVSATIVLRKFCNFACIFNIVKLL